MYSNKGRRPDAPQQTFPAPAQRPQMFMQQPRPVSPGGHAGPTIPMAGPPVSQIDPTPAASVVPPIAAPTPQLSAYDATRAAYAARSPMPAYDVARQAFMNRTR